MRKKDNFTKIWLARLTRVYFNDCPTPYIHLFLPTTAWMVCSRPWTVLNDFSKSSCSCILGMQASTPYMLTNLLWCSAISSFSNEQRPSENTGLKTIPTIFLSRRKQSKCSSSGASGTRNWAVEHNVAAFSEVSFAVRWLGRLSKGYYYE